MDVCTIPWKYRPRGVFCKEHNWVIRVWFRSLKFNKVYLKWTISASTSRTKPTLSSSGFSSCILFSSRGYSSLSPTLAMTISSTGSSFIDTAVHKSSYTALVSVWIKISLVLGTIQATMSEIDSSLLPPFYAFQFLAGLAVILYCERITVLQQKFEVMSLLISLQTQKAIILQLKCRSYKSRFHWYPRSLWHALGNVFCILF